MHMTNRNTIYLITGLLVAGAVLACGCLGQDAANQEQQIVAANGTITYVDLEGGFYGIVAEDGTRYLPLNLSEEYRVDGMNVTFVASVQEDTVTIQQWGTPVEILSIEETDAVAPAEPAGGMIGLADPAAVYCQEQGHAYEIRKNPDGSEYGVCILENGTEVDAWEFYYQNH